MNSAWWSGWMPKTVLRSLTIWLWAWGTGAPNESLDEGAGDEEKEWPSLAMKEDEWVLSGA